MNGWLGDLPQGRRGQLVALGLLLAVAGLLWAVLAAPLLGWYDARAEHLAERELTLAHVRRVAASLPALRAQAGHEGADVPPAAALLGGDTDAVAGAALQGAVQDMATAAGATLASTEVLPGEPRGAFRRIGLRVTLNGDWSVLVALLREIDASKLRLLVDDLQLHVVAQVHPSAAAPIDASLVVIGFRPGVEGRATAALQTP